jgi:nicotinamidase-related amidase
MTRNFNLSRESCGLLVIDVQENLFQYVDRSCEVMQQIQLLIKAFQIMNMPIFVTEQYPQGLGSTVNGLKACLGNSQHYLSKTTFSCLKDPQIKELLLSKPINQWILIGIEAHICVLQTAKDFLLENKQVAIANNAITSRSIYDFSTAIAEMRDIGVRVTSTETLLFELLLDSKDDNFKQIVELIK